MIDRDAALYVATAPHAMAAQLEVAQEYCERIGVRIAATFRDELPATGSGGGLGMQALRATVATGCVRVVVTGALSALALRVVDVEDLVRECDAQSVEVHFADLGPVSRAAVDLAAALNTKRRTHVALCAAEGRSRVAGAGRVPYGRIYGYRGVPDQPGRILPYPDEAAVIVRMYGMAADDDLSPPEIAEALTGYGIPSARRGAWNAIVVAAILRRRLHRGEIVYGRFEHRRDPLTRKVRKLARPENEWVSSPAPELRLVDDATWARAQARLG